MTLHRPAGAIGFAVLATALAGCGSMPVEAGHAASAHAAGELEALAAAYVAAQVAFDQAAIDRMTAARFVEISPKGEVDERDAVIGFYAPEKKTTAPPYRIDAARVRITGDTAVVTQVIEMGTPPRVMRLSQAVTAAYEDGAWMLTSSQTTPMPPEAPKP